LEPATHKAYKLLHKDHQALDTLDNIIQENKKMPR